MALAFPARLAVASVILGVSAHGLTVGCSSFGSATPAPDEAGTEAGDGGGDAAPPTLDAVAPDAASLDAGFPCASPCVNFDSAGWDAIWSPGSVPAPSVSAGQTTSGKYALDVSLLGNSSTLSYRQHAAPAGATKLSLTASIRVEAWGNGEVDLFGIGDSVTLPTSGVFLVHPSAAGASLAAEAPGGGQTGLSASFSNYQRVRLDVDLIAKTYACTIGSEPPVGGSFTAAMKSGNVVLFLGVTYANGVALPWHIRYDDVEFTAQ
jgi:hypothetical protein